jgi:hypothetical protein
LHAGAGKVIELDFENEVTISREGQLVCLHENAAVHSAMVMNSPILRSVVMVKGPLVVP